MTQPRSEQSPRSRSHDASPAPGGARDAHGTVEDTEGVPRGAVLALTAIVVVFLGVAFARSLAVGVPLRDSQGEWLRARLLWTLGVFVVGVAVESLVRALRSRTGWWTAVRERWTLRRLGYAWGGLLLYHVTYFSYHNLKSFNAFRTVRDDWLDSWDRAIFAGHEPAVLLHDVIGVGWQTHVVVGWYEFFPTIVTVAFPLAMVVPRLMRVSWAIIASFVLVWILGVITYYIFPTLGPCYFAPQDFASLPHTVVTETQARYLAERRHFLAHPGDPDARAQIGAFASLHVGVSTVVWLSVRWLRQRWLSLALGIFVAGTWIATIYLGWHFFLDDVAGATIAVLACWGGHRLLYPRRAEADAARGDRPLSWSR